MFVHISVSLEMRVLWVGAVKNEFLFILESSESCMVTEFSVNNWRMQGVLTCP